MTLIDELDALLRPQCPMRAVLDSLSSADRPGIEAALANRKRYPGTALAQFLTAHGHEVSEYAVQDHRAGRCPCSKS